MGRLILRSGMTETEDTYIRDRLMAYNLRMAPPAQDYASKSAELVLEDDQGTLYGGLIGKIYRGCLFIDILWVCEEQRGGGYGKALLLEAEKIAKEAGCSFAHLDTFSFQAPAFYHKNGYETYGLLDLYKDGTKRFYLKKKL